MKIYNVLVKDRHSECFATPFSTEEKARAFAEENINNAEIHYSQKVEGNDTITNCLYYVYIEDCVSIWIIESFLDGEES